MAPVPNLDYNKLAPRVNKEYTVEDSNRLSIIVIGVVLGLIFIGLLSCLIKHKKSKIQGKIESLKQARRAKKYARKCEKASRKLDMSEAEKGNITQPKKAHVARPREPELPDIDRITENLTPEYMSKSPAFL